MTLARLLAHRPGAEDMELPALLAGAAAAGLGPSTHHMTQPGLVARVRVGRFRVLAATAEIAPDPYLARRNRRPRATAPIRLVQP